MAIHFRCSCGKQMQAKDEFAGRKLKCPQCAKVVKIPAAAPAAVPTKTKPAAVLETRRPARAAAPPAAIATLPPPPLAKPVVAAPMARPVAAPVRAEPVAPPRNPWDDRSLVQTATAWLPGDEARFQAGIKPMREGLKCWEKWVLGLVLIGGGAGAIAAVKYL